MPGVTQPSPGVCARASGRLCRCRYRAEVVHPVCAEAADSLARQPAGTPPHAPTLVTRGAGAERRAQNETRMCHCMECCAHGVTERMATDDAVPLTSRGPARRHDAQDERRFARREQRVRGECSAALSNQVAAAHPAVDHTRMQSTIVEPCVALTSCDDDRAPAMSGWR